MFTYRKHAFSVLKNNRIITAPLIITVSHEITMNKRLIMTGLNKVQEKCSTLKKKQAIHAFFREIVVLDD